MPKSKRDVDAGLRRKGFREDATGDHCYFLYYTHDQEQKTPIYTKTSHGCKEIGDPLLHAMARQCGLTKKQFMQLIECPLNRSGYEKILRDANRI